MAKAQRKTLPKALPKQAASTKAGILPVQAIRDLIEVGGVVLGQPLLANQLQPASLDLRLGAKAIRVRASFLPGPGHRVAAKLAELQLHSIDLSNSAVLETGCVYIAPLLESLALPYHLAAATNPKSSTGRLDVFTRVIADGVSAFDQIPAGYAGPLFAEICPQTFPIVVRQGSRLSQIRFRSGFVGDDAAWLASPGQPPGQPPVKPPGREKQRSAAPPDCGEGIALCVDLTGDKDGLVGYRAKRHTGLVDVDAPASCTILDYWEPIFARGAKRLILDPDQFYILASKEAVQVPPTHAAEMVPFNPLVGEFRVHYAGFFDPGFGHAAAGGAGAKAVLEVRSHKVPFILEDGQIVGRLIYEPMTERPEMLYGRGLGSNYQSQGLKLSKHFK
jgi:dCTP deaminase